MKRLGTLAISALLSLGVGAPAYAYHGDDDCQGGGCRREENDYGQCRNVCPTFDKSPVQDSFNFDPQVCLPGATCYFHDRQKDGGQKDGGGQQPAS